MEEYKFAAKLFEGTLLNEVRGLETRDPIFLECLSKFNNQPVKIFQVGAIETFNSNWRIGSGWSDLIFGQYIKENGGSLTVVDIDLDHLAHSHYAATMMQYEINLIHDDAGNCMPDDCDIYYLDGSNDPKETLDQYLDIKDLNAIIIVDDFKIKGTLLKNYLEENKIEYSFFDVANEVIVIENLKDNK